MVFLERAFTSYGAACSMQILCLLKGDQDLFKYVIDYHRDRALPGTASPKYLKGFGSQLVVEKYLDVWRGKPEAKYIY